MTCQDELKAKKAKLLAELKREKEHPVKDYSYIRSLNIQITGVETDLEQLRDELDRKSGYDPDMRKAQI